MAQQPQKASDSKLIFIKFSRVVTYLVYAYSLVASVFLGIGFVLLLFSANPATPFVDFVYKVAYEFLGPFRGIFPARPVGETGYFSSAALFAIIMYLILAIALHALINYITAKMITHQKELDNIESVSVEK